MFTDLYLKVFPYLGEVFGKLSAIAGASCSDIINFLFPSGSTSFLSYTNLFNGSVGMFNGNFLSGLINNIPILEFASSAVNSALNSCLSFVFKFFGILDSPVWIGMLMFSFVGFLSLSIWKFFSN